MNRHVDPEAVLRLYRRVDAMPKPATDTEREIRALEVGLVATSAAGLAVEVIRLREENATLRRMVRESIRMGVIVIPRKEINQ